jgi:type VI secretion system protein ImpF
MPHLHRRTTLQKTAKKAGAPAPLFDRLCDFDLQNSVESPSFNALDFEQLKESILNELVLILNTRHSAKRRAEKDQSGISDYILPQFFGLSDFSWFDINSELGQSQMAQEIEETIAHFEPRLKNVHVVITEIDKRTLALHAVISGDVILNQQKERVSLPITLEGLVYKEKTSLIS